MSNSWNEVSCFHICKKNTDRSVMQSFGWYSLWRKVFPKEIYHLQYCSHQLLNGWGILASKNAWNKRRSTVKEHYSFWKFRGYANTQLNAIITCKISKLCCPIHSSALFGVLQTFYFLHICSINVKTTFIFCLTFILFVIFSYKFIKQSNVNVMGATTYPRFL